MSFLNPAYLWALLGILIPMGIHLWSKKEGRIIKVGSIRYLTESDPKKTSSIKLNEIWLLLLRMLVITVLVLIIAQPRLNVAPEREPITYLVEPSLLSFDEVREMVDGLDDNRSVKLLQPGFPDYKAENFSAKSFPVPDYWQLSEEMEALATDSVVVFMNAFVSGFKGKRPEVPGNINWIVLDPGDVERNLLAAVQKGEEIELILVENGDPNLKFTKERLAPGNERVNVREEKDSVVVSENGESIRLPLHSADTLKILIVHNENPGRELKYLQASYSAIGNYLERSVQIQTVVESQVQETSGFHTVVWLSEEPISQTPEIILAFRQDSLSHNMIEKGNADNIWYLTRPLNSENIVTENLPERLLALIDPYKEIRETAKEYDRRVMDREELLPLQSGVGTDKNLPGDRDLSKYFWMLLLVLLLAERGLARLRKQ